MEDEGWLKERKGEEEQEWKKKEWEAVKKV